ncbi:hypothetical protein BQ8420_10360 [Nocardiopsis sp. JB363]|nr:hypothetical protein BQ8420_10360 [Nocardiopsis sp. JB363]
MLGIPERKASAIESFARVRGGPGGACEPGFGGTWPDEGVRTVRGPGQGG